MAVKITFINGTVNGIEFAEAVKKELKEDQIEMVNNGYNPSEDVTAYVFIKDGIRIGLNPLKSGHCFNWAQKAGFDMTQFKVSIPLNRVIVSMLLKHMILD